MHSRLEVMFQFKALQLGAKNVFLNDRLIHKSREGQNKVFATGHNMHYLQASDKTVVNVVK